MQRKPCPFEAYGGEWGAFSEKGMGFIIHVTIHPYLGHGNGNAFCELQKVELVLINIV